MPDSPPTNKAKALGEAIALARERLAGVDLPSRAAGLGLAAPATDGALSLQVFGRTLLLAPPEWTATDAASGAPARDGERLLALHYLLCDTPLAAAPEGGWITFRDFPGGQFYWEPFRSRTVLPLLRQVGNDAGLLRSRLGRFSWRETGPGDLGARVQAVGLLDLLLVYRAGDAEFGPSLDVLFDARARRVFCAEDAAAMAGRVCLGLL